MWMCGLLLVNGIDAERFSVLARLDVINNKFLYNIQQLFYYTINILLPVIGVKKQQQAAWKNKKTGINININSAVCLVNDVIDISS